MTKIILFNKPCGVISQFSTSPPHQSLKDYIPVTGVYPAGRLDTDSEGLMILTDNGKLQAQISEPRYNKTKTYWVQVDGLVNDLQIQQLSSGVAIDNYISKPALVSIIEEPVLWDRIPPIRCRKNIPTTWLSIAISEGKNRQIRRMTARVGLPTLRLVRVAIGGVTLSGLPSGQYLEITQQQFLAQF